MLKCVAINPDRHKQEVAELLDYEPKDLDRKVFLFLASTTEVRVRFSDADEIGIVSVKREDVRLL